MELQLPLDDPFNRTHILQMTDAEIEAHIKSLRTRLDTRLTQIAQIKEIKLKERYAYQQEAVNKLLTKLAKSIATVEKHLKIAEDASGQLIIIRNTAGERQDANSPNTELDG